VSVIFRTSPPAVRFHKNIKSAPSTTGKRRIAEYFVSIATVTTTAIMAHLSRVGTAA
jgi:hypothetical protein